jgi:uncharacterized protein (TIGR03437 family)
LVPAALLAILPALSRAQTPGECIFPLPEIVSWWPGDGAAHDIVGARHGAFVGRADFDEGKVGQAFVFDGNSEVVVSPDPAFNLQRFTLAAWVRPTSFGDQIEMILNREVGTGATQIQYELGLRGTEPPSGEVNIPVGNLLFFIGGVSGLPSEHRGWVDGRAAAPLNEWTHVALAYDGSTAIAYVNGVETRRIAGLGGSLPVVTSPLKIGSRSDDPVAAQPQTRFNGSIDEAALFGRALSASEVMALFIAGSGGQCRLVNVNAASGSLVTAPSSITSGFMPRLANVTEIVDTTPLPEQLAGVAIRITDSQGEERPAQFYFLAPGQANFYIAPETAPGPALTSVRSGDAVIAYGSVSLNPVAPGVFTINQSGQGAPAARFARYRGSELIASGFVFETGAPVGEIDAVPLDLGPEGEQLFIEIYGTGMRGASQVIATLGGEPVPTSAVAPLEEFVGLDQINIGPIPRSFIGRGEAQLILIMNGSVANAVVLRFQ